MRMVFLQLVPCSNLVNLADSIISQVDHQTRAYPTLTYSFTTFLWHIWRERNSHLFLRMQRSPQHISHSVISMVFPCAVYLELRVPSHIESGWNIPAVSLPVRPIQLLPPMKAAWRFTIAHLFPHMIGILWADKGNPASAASVSSIKDRLDVVVTPLDEGYLHPEINMKELSTLERKIPYSNKEKKIPARD